uniref:Uncharacterized protein n=1 Tax=Oscillatoriales cyanobacterium SpSt-402 TaxID=2282168 RepID=A0A832H5T0_9CYAN
MIRTLGISQFDQCILNISLINLCNQESYVGQSIRQLHNLLDENDAPNDPWRTLHQLNLYIPHPDQQYDGITLQAGLTKGYNIEVKTVADPSQIPCKVPEGGQFVVVMRQKGLDDGFVIAATGFFIRPLALLSLDFIVDVSTPEYQSIVVKHPVIRDYPPGWEDKLKHFLDQTIPYDALPNLVGYVDQAVNRDYRPPSWDEVHLAAKGFAGV